MVGIPNFNTTQNDLNERFGSFEVLSFEGRPEEPTRTPTSTVTPTPTTTPTISITPTSTPTPSNTQTPTPSVTSSITPTRTVTPTISVTPTSTVTPTPSVTPTASITSTQSQTPTPTMTPCASQTPTPSITPTISITPSQTATPTVTPTSSVTPTITSTSSVTPTISVTSSVTNTVTPTQTISSSVTPTPTITKSVTPTPTPTPSPIHSQFVAFSQSTYNMVEGDNVTIEVVRFDDQGDFASYSTYPYFQVDYRTVPSDASAVPDVDYISETGTLEFFGGNPPQMTGSFRIFSKPIPADTSNNESEEFFFVELHNARTEFGQHIKLVENQTVKDSIRSIVIIEEPE